MDRGAWRATAHGVTKSQTRQKGLGAWHSEPLAHFAAFSVHVLHILFKLISKYCFVLVLL